jgi:hypothetical protein
MGMQAEPTWQSWQVGILLNSALHLCSIAASAAALEWAEQLWHLASLSGGETPEGTWRFEATRVNYVTWCWTFPKGSLDVRKGPRLNQWVLGGKDD